MTGDRHVWLDVLIDRAIALYGAGLMTILLWAVIVRGADGWDVRLFALAAVAAYPVFLGACRRLAGRMFFDLRANR